MEDALLKKAYIGLLAVAAMAAVVAGCGTAPATGVAQGKLVFNTCVPCHGENGGGNARLRAPSIAGLPEWYLVRQLQNFQKDVRGAQRDDMEGHRMRPMARSLYHAGDLEAVSKYVAGLPMVPQPISIAEGDKAAGETTYTSVCIACHGADGTGMEAVGSPRIAGQADWYLYLQLQKFHSGMRGTHPEDTYGAQMRAMALTLADSTAMKDVVAYIRSIPVK